MIGSGVIYALILIVGFIGIMFLLDKWNLLEPMSMEMSGPLLMWRTKKGRDLIDKIANKKRFWQVYGNICIVITALAMIIILGMVILNAIVAGDVPAEQAPRAEEILVIPGVNPFIPIGYGILSLAVGIIIHEFSHAILTRVGDIEVKSLGLIFLVVPLGAFCEPNEEEIEETERLKRDRMFAAGPSTNIILGIVIFLIFSTFFMGAVSPEEDGLLVMEIYGDTPADEAEIRTFDHILEIDGERTRDRDTLENIDVEVVENGIDETNLSLRKVNLTARRGKEEVIFDNVTPGLVVVSIREDSPAMESDLEIGDVLSHIDGTEIRNRSKFSEILGDRNDDEEIKLTYWRKNNTEYQMSKENLTLEDGSLGVGVSYLGIGYQEGDWYPKMLSNPITSAETNTEAMQNVFMYIALPLLRLSPVPEELTGFYEISGPMGSLPTSAFWLLANSLYWILWLNILLGLFNALPALPLDGGRLVKDWFESLTERLGYDENIQEKVSSGAVTVLSLTVLFLLAWSMIGPWI